MLRGDQVMRGHLPGQKRANEDPPLPVLPARIQPQTFDDVERGLIDWLPKIQNVRSGVMIIGQTSLNSLLLVRSRLLQNQISPTSN